MPYFTTETVVSVAARHLAQTGRAPSVANASDRLIEEAEQVGFPAEPTEVKPTVLFDIFLSHSSLDQLQVLGIYRLLIQRGYKVYLDQGLRSLPGSNACNTANRASNSVSDGAEQVVVRGDLEQRFTIEMGAVGN